MIDLHIHTNASADGQHPPEEIVAQAAQLGLFAIAFADHDSVESVPAGRELCREAGIKFVECIELNTLHHGADLHLLGYGVRPENTDFKSWLAEIATTKEKKARQWAKKLNDLGCVLEYEEVAALTPGRLPTGSSYLRALEKHPENRAHPLVAPFLPGGNRSDNPYVNFYFEVLAAGPARVDIEEVTTIGAIRRLLDLRAVPVLAHPAGISPNALDDLVRHGLTGLEAISSYHDAAATQKHLRYASEKRLLVTAGSDFHGKAFKKDVALGGIEGNEDRLFEMLIEALEKMRRF